MTKKLYAMSILRPAANNVYYNAVVLETDTHVVRFGSRSQLREYGQSPCYRDQL